MNRLVSSLLCVALLFPLCAAGCAKSSEAPINEYSIPKPIAPKSADPRLASTYYDNTSSMSSSTELPVQGKVGGGERKLILSGEIRVKIADFNKAEQDLYKLIQAHKGFTAQADVTGNVGGLRQGIWKVRLPPAETADFSEAVKKLGELIHYYSETKEVTEEYFDLQMRLKNKEAELESLRKIFDKGSGKIEEVLTVQKEVSRAQDELERMKGRQRVLDNLIELTTVTVRLEERDTFTSPAPLTPVAFGTSIGQTFDSSIDALVAVGKALVLIAVAVGPWLPVMAVPAAVVWLSWRRRKAISPQQPTNPAGFPGK